MATRTLEIVDSRIIPLEDLSDVPTGRLTSEELRPRTVGWNKPLNRHNVLDAALYGARLGGSLAMAIQECKKQHHYGTTIVVPPPVGDVRVVGVTLADVPFDDEILDGIALDRILVGGEKVTLESHIIVQPTVGDRAHTPLAPELLDNVPPSPRASMVSDEATLVDNMRPRAAEMSPAPSTTAYDAQSARALAPRAPGGTINIPYSQGASTASTISGPTFVGNRWMRGSAALSSTAYDTDMDGGGSDSGSDFADSDAVSEDMA